MESLAENNHVAELKEAFTLFDTDGDGLISAADIGKVMLQLGFNPTEAEVADLVVMVDTEGKDAVDFNAFLAMVDITTQNQAADPEEELRAAFRVFDKEGKGYMDAADLRAILTSMGETLSEEEVDEMIAVANDGTGNIVFEDFIKMMSSK